MKSFYNVAKRGKRTVPQTITTAMMMGLKGIWENEYCWKQANGVKEIIYWKQAMMAVALVRKWDRKHGGAK